MGERLRIDHAVIAVRDLEATAARLLREFGLDAVEGGVHAAWGTANRIVPLGPAYVELIAVVDPVVAGASPFGVVVAEAAAGGDRTFTYCVATDDLDTVADRLGLEIVEGERRRPDGTLLRWRSAGLEDPRREPWMPFFIAWETPPTEHPGRERVRHRVEPIGISGIDVAGDGPRLRDWLGPTSLPVHLVPGDPGVKAVRIATTAGELRLP